MPRILLTAAVALAAAIAVPSIANAATIHQYSRMPHRILLQDTADQTNLVSVEGSKSVVLHDTSVPTEGRGHSDVHVARPLHRELLGVRNVELDLGAGRTSRGSTRRSRWRSTAAPAATATTSRRPAGGRG